MKKHICNTCKKINIPTKSPLSFKRKYIYPILFLIASLFIGYGSIWYLGVIALIAGLVINDSMFRKKVCQYCGHEDLIKTKKTD